MMKFVIQPLDDDPHIDLDVQEIDQNNNADDNSEPNPSAAPPIQPMGEYSPLRIMNPAIGYLDEEAKRSLTIIIWSTIVLTIIITIALLIQIFVGLPQILPNGVIMSNEATCSAVGKKILMEGGQAGDIAIAVMFCLATVNPLGSGISGGGFGLIRNHREGINKVINFQFLNPVDSHYNYSYALPREMEMLEYLKETYSKLPLSTLLATPINLATNGFPMSKGFIDLLISKYDKDNDIQVLPLFLQDKSKWKVGTIVKRPKFAHILQQIANNGIGWLRNGEVFEAIQKKLKPKGLSDRRNYVKPQIHVQESKGMAINQDYQIHLPIGADQCTGLGAMAVVSGKLEKTLEKKDSEVTNATFTPNLYHMLIEAVKHVYSKSLGDRTSEEYLDGLVAQILQLKTAIPTLETANAAKEILDQKPEAGANYMSVVDGDDVIITLVSSLGSKSQPNIWTPNGIPLNNGRLSSRGKKEITSPSLPCPIHYYSDLHPCEWRVATVVRDTPEEALPFFIVLESLFLSTTVVQPSNLKNALQIPRVVWSSDSGKLFFEKNLPISVQNFLTVTTKHQLVQLGNNPEMFGEFNLLAKLKTERIAQMDQTHQFEYQETMSPQKLPSADAPMVVMVKRTQ
ncbi:hypothetical protein SNEBB_003586 [Seison nebaliae]|nr:hypothetical protein SNEBB_003586 [Seison nebaliae]